MTESLLTKEQRTKEDWLEIFEVNKESKTNLKKSKIVCEEKINKIDREIDLLNEKKQPFLVKLNAINHVIRKLDKEGERVESDRMFKQKRRMTLFKKEKEIRLFYAWRKENRSEFKIEIQDRIFDGIDKEGLSFNSSLMKYIRDKNDNEMNDVNGNDMFQVRNNYAI